MNAIELLDQQHRDVEQLFNKLESSRGDRKRELFRELADWLSIHATIEENHFYPMVKTADTEELLLESLEEHLAIKRLLADLMKMSIDAEEFDAKLTVLDEQVAMHVREERNQLFPQVRRLLDKDQLEAVGQIMIDTVMALQGKAPRLDVLAQTRQAAPLKSEPATRPPSRLAAPFLALGKAMKQMLLGVADVFRGAARPPQRRRPA